uniref:Uncharacterized protein n=1 Tax=Ciona savignyi TaxID=51511 RepID=H2ZI65_CIOSA
MLPVCPVCAITSQDLSLSVDGVTFSSADGSRWPACCCTFIPQQTYKKRRSNYSPLFAKTCNVNDDHWIKELLKSPCLFSGTPLT